MTAAARPLPAAVRELDVGDALDDTLPVIDLGDDDCPPPPQQFVIEDYVPAGCVTSLYAKGGSSKSFLALLIAFHIVRGEDIFGRRVQRGPVVYLDAELDAENAQRRAWMIANGLGIERPPRGITYHRLRGSLTDAECNGKVRRLLGRQKPQLTIIDSFTAAVRGKDANSIDDVSDRLRWLEDFGTVLMIDHTPKSADITSNVTAFGSVAKQMFARSCLFIASNGNASILRHEKSNFGRLAEPVKFALNFGPEFVALEAPLPDDDPRLHGIEGALPAKERVRVAMYSGEFPSQVTAAEIADALDLSQSTVSNALTALKREGAVLSTGKGKWAAAP